MAFNAGQPGCEAWRAFSCQGVYGLGIRDQSEPPSRMPMIGTIRIIGARGQFCRPLLSLLSLYSLLPLNNFPPDFSFDFGFLIRAIPFVVQPMAGKNNPLAPLGWKIPLALLIWSVMVVGACSDTSPPVFLLSFSGPFHFLHVRTRTPSWSSPLCGNGGQQGPPAGVDLLCRRLD